MKTVILINGLPRVGKDTFADFISEHKFNKISFVEPLIQLVASRFNISFDELDIY